MSNSNSNPITNASPTPLVPISSLTSLALRPSQVTSGNMSSSSSPSTTSDSTSSSISNVTPVNAFLTGMSLTSTATQAQPCSDTPSETQPHASPEPANTEGRADDDNARSLSPGSLKKRKHALQQQDDVQPIQCVSCLMTLHPDYTECFRCGGDPRVKRQYVGPTVASTSTSSPFLAQAVATPSTLSFPSPPSCQPVVNVSAANLTLAGQSWINRGAYVPISEEAVNALRSGTYKEIGHYLPKRISLHNITTKDQLNFKLEEGQLVVKPTANTRRVTTFEELYDAHHQSIIPLLVSFGDHHRVAAYGRLWSTMATLHAKRYPFTLLLQYYEVTRLNHPGVNDDVGALDPIIQSQLMVDIAAYALPASSRGATAVHNAMNSTPGASATSGVGNRQKVCMEFNDLKCTQQPCPKGLPHLCCRCFNEHAASNGCTKPDPRQSRGGRGGRGSGKSKSGASS